MKRLSFAFALIVMMAVPAFAADGGLAPYVEVKAGGAYEQIDSIKNTSTSVAAGLDVNKRSVSDWVGTFGAAAGLNFKGMGVPVRAELEYDYRSELSYSASPTLVVAGVGNTSSAKINSQTLFANVYYDIETGSAFTPYVGGGLGIAWNEVRNASMTVTAAGLVGTSSEKSRITESFAWNLGAGCAYDLSANWKLNLGYRYVDLGKVVSGSSDSVQLTSKDITAHEVLLGLRYQF